MGEVTAVISERPGGVPTAALALLIAALGAATIAGAWGLQFAGYVPCELCLAERNPYYVGIPLALVTAWFARGAPSRLPAYAFTILALLFLGSAVLAAYHTGVEWRFWAGPTGCSGAVAQPTSVADFMKELQSVKVVRCDAPALLVFGLSLAAWNVLVSLLLCLLAAWGARRTFRLVRR